MAALLTTKLYIPPAPAALVERARFRQALERVLQYRLVLITAPAGFGKTTMLSSWLQAIQVEPATPTVAWLTLDERDNDAQRFWEYVVTALARVGLDGADALIERLYQSDAVAEPFFTALINRIMADIPAHFILVLDDYQCLNAEQLHDGLAFLLEHMPPHMHLVVSGRVEPPMALAALRARGQMLELDAEDLRFTQEETAELVRRVYGFQLSTGSIDALTRRTEGWVAGILLAAMSLRDCLDPDCFIRSFSGSMRYIGDYLAEQVLGHLEPEVQDFLLDTSILETLNGSLCDALTGRADGQQMLERLQAYNLFTVALADDRKWFRYHQLMAEFLIDRLKHTHPGRVQALHRRAATWYAQNGMIEEAVQHALEAKDYELAVRLIGRLQEQIRTHSRVRTLLNWMRALPEDLIRSKPHLCMGYAWLLAIRGHFDEVERLVTSVEGHLARDEAEEGAAQVTVQAWPYTSQGIRADLYILRAFMARFGPEPQEAVEYANQALAIIPQGCERERGVALVFRGHARLLCDKFASANQDLLEAASLCRSAGHIVGYLSALHYLAQLRLIQGCLPLVLAQYRQAESFIDEQRQPIYAGIEHIGLGDVYRQWNDLEAAGRHLGEGTRLAEVGGDFVFLRDAYIACSQLEFARGDIERALVFVHRAEAAIRRSAPGWDQRMVQAWKARYWIAQGDLAAAQYWAERAGLDPQARPHSWETLEYLTLARLLLAQGEHRQATGLLERMLASAQDQERMGHAAEVSVLLARAHQALGQHEDALLVMKKALKIAEPQGYVRIFVDEGLPVAQLLHQLVHAGSNGLTAYVEELLNAFGEDILRQVEQQQSSPRMAMGVSSGLLSERELQVLALIEKGCSYREIADDLVIALSTVQTHVKNAYSKLNAHSGMEAVSRARELNLMP